MRVAGFVAFAFLASPALAQAPQKASGDFDGDGKPDIVEWVSQRSGLCVLQVHLGAKPDAALTVIEGGGTLDCPEVGNGIEVRRGGSFTVKDFSGERAMTFAHDVILSARRPGVRSVSYWDGKGFAGTWIPD